LAIVNFIKLGVRPSLIPLLASYLTDRKMKLIFNNKMSEFLTLIGGGLHERFARRLSQDCP
jgi:hypothetical protein